MWSLPKSSLAFHKTGVKKTGGEMFMTDETEADLFHTE